MLRQRMMISTTSGYGSIWNMQMVCGGSDIKLLHKNFLVINLADKDTVVRGFGCRKNNVFSRKIIKYLSCGRILYILLGSQMCMSIYMVHCIHIIFLKQRKPTAKDWRIYLFRFRPIIGKIFNGEMDYLRISPDIYLSPFSILRAFQQKTLHIHSISLTIFSITQCTGYVTASKQIFVYQPSSIWLKN